MMEFKGTDHRKFGSRSVIRRSVPVAALSGLVGPNGPAVADPAGAAAPPMSAACDPRSHWLRVSFGGLATSLRRNAPMIRGIALGLAVYLSPNAFAGRDGAQMTKQDIENKRVARERRATCTLSGRKITSQTMAHGARLFSLPGTCSSPDPHAH